MNEFDQFMKHILRIKSYFRYTDDFVIVSDNKECLNNLLAPISEFLQSKLILTLHPQKVSIRSLHQGIDFLGYAIFSHHRLIRAKTKKRIFKKLRFCVAEYKNNHISRQTLEQSLQSYLGVLSHANSFKIKKDLPNKFQAWLKEYPPQPPF